MPVLLTLDVPINRAALEAVSDEMGVRAKPPEGLIAHVVIDTTDGCQVIDIWESADDFARFRDARLMPATEKVLSTRGIPLQGGLPEPVITEAYDLVRGVAAPAMP